MQNHPMRQRTGPVRSRGVAAIVAALLAVYTLPLAAQPKQHELVFFLSADADAHSGLDNPYIESNERTPTGELLYSLSSNRLRLLSEYVVTDEESDLERFQVGWQLSEATRIWFGRFHNSRSFWNTEHHHGQFLQTSITRPASENFEDFIGILPTHTTGMLVETRHELGGKAAFRLAASAGLSARLLDDGLSPFDLLAPESGHEPGLDIRLGWLPDAVGENEIGLLVGDYSVPVDQQRILPPSWDPLTDKIKIDTRGVYGTWILGNWHVLGSVTEVQTRGRGGTDGRAREFSVAYAQVEYMLNEQTILYGRVEDTSRNTNYLDLFPGYLTRQDLVGVKRYLTQHQAVTVEIAGAETLDDRFNRVSVQWSAAFP